MEAHKETLLAYLRHHNYELTDERQIMIRAIGQMEVFSWPAFKKECARQDVNLGTAYNFKKILLAAGIIIPEVVIPMRFADGQPDISSEKPKNDITKIKAAQVQTRLRNSHQNPRYL